MKQNITLKTLLAGILTIGLGQLHTPAAPLVTELNQTNPIVVNTLPNSTTGPSNTGTTGEGGYELFDVTNAGTVAAPLAGDVSNLPTYVTGLSADGTQPYRSGFTNITAGTTSYPSGQLYVFGTGALDLATFELTGTLPTNGFDVDVLRDYPDTTSYTLSLYSGTPSPSTLLSSDLLNTAGVKDGTAGNADIENQFFFASVTGASAGDYLVISAAASNAQVTLGGISFDSIPTTPEPSTYALMLGGLGALALVARLRRNA
jgi:hypothetical protein